MSEQDFRVAAILVRWGIRAFDAGFYATAREAWLAAAEVFRKLGVFEKAQKRLLAAADAAEAIHQDIVQELLEAA